MGWVLCKKHGGNTINLFIEKDICQKIYHQIPLSDTELVIICVEVFDEAGKEHVCYMNHLFTKKFQKENNLPDYCKIVREEDLYQWEQMTGITCGKCFREFAQANGWSEQFINYAKNNF